MPAAAVIPAPIAYIKVAAVKKLVVGFRGVGCFGYVFGRMVHRAVRTIAPQPPPHIFFVEGASKTLSTKTVTLSKFERSKQTSMS